jgi:hypothetical protein
MRRRGRWQRKWRGGRTSFSGVREIWRREEREPGSLTGAGRKKIGYLWRINRRGMTIDVNDTEIDVIKRGVEDYFSLRVC